MRSPGYEIGQIEFRTFAGHQTEAATRGLHVVAF